MVFDYLIECVLQISFLRTPSMRINAKRQHRPPAGTYSLTMMNNLTVCITKLRAYWFHNSLCALYNTGNLGSHQTRRPAPFQGAPTLAQERHQVSDLLDLLDPFDLLGTNSRKCSRFCADARCLACAKGVKFCREDRIPLSLQNLIPTAFHPSHATACCSLCTTEVVPEEEGGRWTRSLTIERGRARGIGFEPPSESN